VIVIVIVLSSRAVKNKKEKELINEANMSVKDFEQLISSNRRKIGKLRSNIYRIRDTEVKNNVSQIADSSKWIIDNLEKNPSDLNGTKRFLNYYLDATINIVTNYVVLMSGEGYSEKQKNALEKSKDTILLINESFKKQKTKLLDNDFLDLKVEMEVLERALKVDGGIEEK